MDETLQPVAETNRDTHPNRTTITPFPDDVNHPILILSYTTDTMDVHETTDLDVVVAAVKDPRVTWVMLRYGAGAGALRYLIDQLGLPHDLVNDMLDSTFREFESEYDECFYLEYDILHLNKETRSLRSVNGSMILGERYLILYEAVPSPLFERMRRQIETGKTRAQRYGPDYLVYLLMRGAIVENYKQVLRHIHTYLEDIEESMIESPSSDEPYHRLLAARQRVKPFYPYILDLREFLLKLRDAEMRYVSPPVRKLMVKNLTHEIEDLTLSYVRLREWVHELVELYRANTNDSTNNVMKLLTIISTIFLPLSFIAGVYGMNFEYMPELSQPWGYPITLLVMATIGGGIVYYAWRHKWFD